MKLKKVNKKLLFVGAFALIILCGIIYSGDLVTAETKVTVKVDDPKVRICYDRKTGAFIESHEDGGSCASGSGADVIKYIDDDYAYCVNWKLKFIDHDSYVLDEEWKQESENAIIAGYLINYINKLGFSYDKAYARTGATLNTLFADYVGDTGSYDFSSDNDISSYIKTAKNYYGTVKNEKTLPDVKISQESDVLNYNGTDGTDGYYYSGKVTVSGLLKNYGGDDAVSYKITAKTKDGVVVDICSGSDRTGCAENGVVTFSSSDTAKSYYLFVDANKVDSTDIITLNVSGSNKSTYYSSALYKDVVNKEAQRVIRQITYDVSRSSSNNVTFTIPSLVGHQISVYKVDEDGEEVCGATLEIYRDDPKGENVSNRIATNTSDDDGDDCRITYKTDSTTEGEDDFYSHDYYLIERSAPDGFVLSDSVRHFYEKNSLSADDKMTLTCYKNTDGELEEVDMEYCYPENYSFMCKNKTDPTDLREPDASGNCPTTTSGDSGLETSGLIDNSGINTNAITGDGEQELNALYTKVCYNTKEQEIVDDNSLCNSDGNYTKIWTGHGNITVRQLNVRNVVNISKMDVTKKEEVVGASLKVCTADSYECDGTKCDPAKTYDNVEMSWVSDDVPHSIYGILAGEYYIIEEIPPKGYLKATTAVKFSIDKYGKVVTGDETITNADFLNNGSVIVVDNNLSKITISKQDVATSKELAGATISICESYRDDENDELHMKVDQYTGDCIEAVLADGSVATWISTNKPKEIEGLNPGTYYLVERIAPTDYTTAESIIFTLNEDGTLADKDGKSLDGNKITMYDKRIDDKKTGAFNVYMVIGIGMAVVALGIGTYYYLNKTKVDTIVKEKIRKRKIHLDKVNRDE